MNSLLLRLLVNLPPFAKKQALVLLFRATADAFECELPPLAGLTWGECLREYARFTPNQAENSHRDGRDLTGLQNRLYCNTYRLGQTCGRLMDIRNVEEVMVIGQVLYSFIGIDFEGSQQGEITIPRCYFSHFYTPEICRLISSMDRGLLAGLAGGGDLAFSERITDGNPCCRAHFTLETASIYRNANRSE